MIYSPEDRVRDIEWLTTCLVVWGGANDVKLDIEGREIKAVQFKFPSGRECRLVYANHTARPCLIIGRGRT